MDRTARIVAGEIKNMTPEDIIRMAREAGLQQRHATPTEWWCWEGSIERFAALVAAALRDAMWEKAMKLVAEAAAAEREACAKLAETTVCDTHLPTGVQIYGSKAAAAIRARSKT
jgi:hypothetical protein